MLWLIDCSPRSHTFLPGILVCFDRLFVMAGSGNPPYSRAAAGATWRLSFGVLIPVVIYFLYYRVYVLKELKELDRVKKRDSIKGVPLDPRCHHASVRMSIYLAGSIEHNTASRCVQATTGKASACSSHTSGTGCLGRQPSGS